ncbi:MAG TPA: hypothetical protein VJ508_14120, partial [Saprospiraceae bacterium]|nr:hypothetical protein [Saprospiraceae bacterium]
MRADSTVNRSSLRILLDGVDVSSNAVISNDIVVVPPPAALRGGNHSIKIEVYSSDGSSAHVTAWDFILKTDETYTLSPPATSWRYTSNLQAETRNENISSSTTPYNRLLLAARGDYDQFQIGGSLYVTNEETERRQPQNRYFIGGESRWLRLGYGDHYPVFPDLIMTGKRVRGFEGNIAVGFFNLDISKGDILRRVESDTVKTFPFDSLSVEQSKNNTASFGPYDQNRWAQFRYGTFSRDLLVIRPSFGRREETHFGFTYLKSKDDITSILYGGKPRENLVLGTDMLIPFDNHNVEISGQAAFSATNNDITNGTFSDERIDSIYGDYSESSRNTIRRVRDIFSNYITINENLIPLNLTHTPT